MTTVALHEEHGEAVSTWVERGYRDEHVVCLDRHLDLKPLADTAAARCTGSAGDPSALNRALPVREAPGAFGLDDFWSVGPLCGRVGKLTWVIPSISDGAEARRRLLSTVAFIRASPDVLNHTEFDGDRLSTRLCGLRVDIRSLADLFGRPPAGAFRIDVDLDWFAEPGQPDEFDPRLLVDELDERGWLGRLDSVTYSVRSGFLQEPQRRIADDLLTAAERPGRRSDGPLLHAAPHRTLAALRTGTAPDPEELRDIVETELVGLGAVGTSLHGLLQLYCSGAIDEAEESWSQAAAAGVCSSWLAYGLGQHWYRRGMFSTAQRWLDRACGELNDPLEGHAQVLAALCSARLGDPGGAADRAAALAGVFPLNERVATLAVAACRRAKRPVDPEIEQRLHLFRTWAKDGEVL